jgi:hypothetical protein
MELVVLHASVTATPVAGETRVRFEDSAFDVPAKDGALRIDIRY